MRLKKLLLTTFSLMAFCGFTRAEDFVVYNNGQLTGGLRVDSWYNAIFSFDATAPSGTDKCFQFKAGDANVADASGGLYMEHNPYNTGILNDATLNFDWYAEGTGTYIIRLVAVNQEDYTFTVTPETAGKWNTTSLKVSTYFPTVAQQWKNNDNDGNGYIFGLVFTQGAAGDVIYFNNIYYSNVDNSWKAPEKEVTAPTSVPTPTQETSDVLSIFSSTYPAATTFNIGNWGQSTNSTLTQIDGTDVYRLRNFNYLGWELNSDIDISDYDYMHVDFWPVSATGFGFSPVTRAGGSATENVIAMTQVNVQEWNSYDVPLSDWSNLNLSEVFQIKFDKGTNNAEAYLANVYFYKTENGGGSDEPDPTPGETNSCTATMKDVQLNGETKDIEVTLNYTIVRNDDGTLTITLVPENADFYNIVGIVPQLFINGAHAGNFQGSGPYTFTTSESYNINDKVTMYFFCAYAIGSATFPEFTYTVDGPTGLDAAEVSEFVDVYTLTGIRVAKDVKAAEVKSLVDPGLYIVGGKKVVVK